VVPMSNLPSELLKVEEDRIQAVYAERQVGLRYSFFDPGHLFMVQERERHVLGLLNRFGYAQLETKKILEIGCGTGYWCREFIKWGARPENIFGIDILSERIAEARRLSPAAVSLQWGNASNLSFPDAMFDLVFQSTVFTSILDARLKGQIASEMQRVLKPEGAIVWYDFFINNPKNPNVRGVGRNEIRLLFPHCEIHFRRVTLAPPIARTLARRSWLICSCLSSLRFLNTHYLALIRKKG